LLDLRKAIFMRHPARNAVIVILFADSKCGKMSDLVEPKFCGHKSV